MTALGIRPAGISRVWTPHANRLSIRHVGDCDHPHSSATTWAICVGGHVAFVSGNRTSDAQDFGLRYGPVDLPAQTTRRLDITTQATFDRGELGTRSRLSPVQASVLRDTNNLARSTRNKGIRLRHRIRRGRSRHNWAGAATTVSSSNVGLRRVFNGDARAAISTRCRPRSVPLPDLSGLDATANRFNQNVGDWTIHIPRPTWAIWLGDTWHRMPART